MTDKQLLGSGGLQSEIGFKQKRKKVPLRPGHSLADWIRLSKQNPGIGRTSCPADSAVTMEELSRHNTLSDCWIGLRGKAYNVTPYLDYHPGGPDEILAVSGKDATEAFNEIHAWVNYESLLRVCLIGPLASKFDKTRYDKAEQNIKTSTSS